MKSNGDGPEWTVSNQETRMTSESVYRDLQRHLDELPVGYPPTESGVEIRILKHLFTPEEAALAAHLSVIPEPLSRIHMRLGGKTGMSLPELEELLDRMFRKGTVLMKSERGEKCYSNAMLIVGMFELQVERMRRLPRSCSEARSPNCVRFRCGRAFHTSAT
jgi:electron transport complex protein RnfB